MRIRVNYCLNFDCFYLMNMRINVQYVYAHELKTKFRKLRFKR